MHEALAHLPGSNHGLILADLTLPDSVSRDMIAALVRAAPALPVVALTGSEDPKLESMALTAGVHDFIFKLGLRERLLRRIVRFAIERSRVQAQRDLERREFVTTVKHAPLALVTLDSAGRLLHTNPAAEATFGWPLGEVRGEIPPWLPEGAGRLATVPRAARVAPPGG